MMRHEDTTKDIQQQMELSQDQNAQSRPISRPTSPPDEEKVAFTKDFRHSGLNYSKRRKFVVVDNNAINHEIVRPNTTQSG